MCEINQIGEHLIKLIEMQNKTNIPFRDDKTIQDLELRFEKE